MKETPNLHALMIHKQFTYSDIYGIILIFDAFHIVGNALLDSEIQRTCFPSF